MKMEDYKTSCCKADWYVKSRANYRCSKCKKDVTMEVLLLADFIEKENELKKVKK